MHKYKQSERWLSGRKRTTRNRLIGKTIRGFESHPLRLYLILKMTTKLEGFQNRQKDVGWGYAIAHIVPFVGLYYAITRRTITPFLFAFLGNLAIGFTYGLIVAIINPNYDEEKLENSATLIGLVTAPILAKKGIEKARKYGKEKIDSN